MTNPLTVAVEALEPFAKAMDDYGDDAFEASAKSCWDHPLSMLVMVGDFRRAVTALATLKTAQEGEGGPDAYQIIAEANRRSMMMRGGGRDTSRDPLLGPPDDMAVSRVLLAERPDFDPKEADRLAVKIADALRATKTAQEEQAPSRPSQDLKAAVAKIIRQMIAEGNARPLSERSEEAAERILSALNAPGSGGEEEEGRSGAESVQESWAQPAFNTAAQAIRDLVRERDFWRDNAVALSVQKDASEALCLRLREALEPFAQAFDRFAGDYCHVLTMGDWMAMRDATDVRDFRRASQALSSGTGDREEGGEP